MGIFETRTFSQHSDCQSVHLIGVIREVGLDSNSWTISHFNGEALHNRKVLLIDVHHLQVIIVIIPSLVEAESDGFSLGLDLREQVQGLEGCEVDGVNVGARSRHDEGLVESVEGKFTGARGKEWQLAGNFAL